MGGIVIKLIDFLLTLQSRADHKRASRTESLHVGGGKRVQRGTKR